MTLIVLSIIGGLAVLAASVAGLLISAETEAGAPVQGSQQNGTRL